MNFSVDTSQHDFTADDLYLLSNDIPQSHTPECEEDSDSEELDVGRLNHMNRFSMYIWPYLHFRSNPLMNL